MAHDIFVSHSTKDKIAADAVVAHLERDGLRCWCAPRDIVPHRNLFPELTTERLSQMSSSGSAEATRLLGTLTQNGKIAGGR